MNDNACAVFLNLINLAVRMMPIFLCLEPRQKNRENIAAVSVYLWVVMISMQSLFHMNETQFLLFSGVFSCLFFLVLLIFFDGSLLKKAFLYLSAWLLAALSNSLNAFAAWVLRGAGNLTSLQVGVIVSFLSACSVYLFVRFWLKEVTERLFRPADQPLLPSPGYPAAALAIILYGTSTIFSRVLAVRGFQDIIFYLALCVMILILYVMILAHRRHCDKEKDRGGIEFCQKTDRQPAGALQPDAGAYGAGAHHPPRFRHHIHALEHMDLDAQKQYPAYLTARWRRPPRSTSAKTALSTASYRRAPPNAARTESISKPNWTSPHIPIDDLTLCIVTGNLINNAIDLPKTPPPATSPSAPAGWRTTSCSWSKTPQRPPPLRPRNLPLHQTRWRPGLLSVRRILNQPGDEFDIDYNDTMFTAMVKIGWG
ncbi:MAG: histidine kinase [Hungatella hathewayi]